MNSLIKVERWGTFELAIYSGDGINSIDEPLGKTVFFKGNRVKEAVFFRDGSGPAKVRFMPDEEGEWQYEVHSGFVAQDGSGNCGRFECTAPGSGNRGPVRVTDNEKFSYADGTPFYPFGTTCLNGYTGSGQEATLRSLEQAPFNKVRLTVVSGLSEFAALEQMVIKLMQLGVEAELLLDCTDAGALTDNKELISRTVIRLAAYRNVWWALLLPKDNGLSNSFRAEVIPLIQELDSADHLLSVYTNDPLSETAVRDVTHVSLL